MTPEKLLNIGDIVYQFTWENFEGSVFEREVDCVIYYEHAKPEDCFYRYSLKGLCFYQENQITNSQMGTKWFASRPSAQAALDKELAERKANYEASLKKDIEDAQKKLNSLPA